MKIPRRTLIKAAGATSAVLGLSGIGVSGYQAGKYNNPSKNGSSGNSFGFLEVYRFLPFFTVFQVGQKTLPVIYGNCRP